MEIHQVLGLVRKWFWLIILAVLIGGIVGLLVSFLEPKTYEADTTIYIVSPNRTDVSTLYGDQEAAKAFASIPTLQSVLAAALQTLGDKTLSQSKLSSMVTVRNNLATQFVVIGVRDSDPNRAALLAREIAKQSIAQFEATKTDGGQTRQFVKQELDRVGTEIIGLEKKLATIQSRATPGSTTSQTALITRLSDDRTLYSQLLNTYTNMSGTQAVVVQEAQPPKDPVAPVPALAVVIGMLVGLVTMVGVIFFIERSDDVLRTPVKVGQATGLSTFIMVGYLSATARQAFRLNGYHDVTGIDTVKVISTKAKQARQLAPQEEGITEDTARSLPAIRTQAPAVLTDLKVKDKGLNRVQLPEDFLALGVLLRGECSRLASNGRNFGSLLVTSPENGDGKTLMASQIALGLARIGVEVVLVDANLREPNVHNIFGLSNSIGLSSILTGDDDSTAGQILHAALQKTQEPNLMILPGGSAIDSPAEILSSLRMQATLNELGQDALVVIDGPAVLTSSESVILADKSDAILMIVDASSTSSTSLNRSLEILNKVNRNILGGVLNRVSNRKYNELRSHK